MKKYLTILLLLFLCFDVAANKIGLYQNGQMPTHSEYYPPADMPEVYFNSNEMEIIIVADGFADYYDVEIVSLGSLLTVISTQVDGYGDSIDVSSLSIGDYRIVITSSNNNVFEGDFAIE